MREDIDTGEEELLDVNKAKCLTLAAAAAVATVTSCRESRARAGDAAIRADKVQQLS